MNSKAFNHKDNVDIAYLLETCDHLKAVTFERQDDLLDELRRAHASKLNQITILVTRVNTESDESYLELHMQLPHLLPNATQVRINIHYNSLTCFKYFIFIFLNITIFVQCLCIFDVIQILLLPYYHNSRLTHENVPDIVAAWLTYASTSQLHLKLFVYQNILIDSLVTNLNSMKNVVKVAGRDETKFAHGFSMHITVQTNDDRFIELELQNAKWF
jgi:hypothetical protein